MSYANFRELMIGTYYAETLFGTYRTKVSKTDVVGELQVTRKTFKEQIVDSKHPFGPMIAAKLDAEMGGKGTFKIDNLRKLKDKELRKLLLENHIFNFIAGSMIMLNKLQG